MTRNPIRSARPTKGQCAGPRALTEKDLRGYTQEQWREIAASESEGDWAYMCGVRRKGWLAARRGKPRNSPYVPGKFTSAWLTGYDEHSLNK